METILNLGEMFRIQSVEKKLIQVEGLSWEVVRDKDRNRLGPDYNGS